MTLATGQTATASTAEPLDAKATGRIMHLRPLRGIIAFLDRIPRACAQHWRAATPFAACAAQ